MGVDSKSKVRTDWHNTEHSGVVRETIGRRSFHKCPKCKKRMRKIKKYFKGGGTNTTGFYCEKCNIREEELPDYW